MHPSSKLSKQRWPRESDQRDLDARLRDDNSKGTTRFGRQHGAHASGTNLPLRSFGIEDDDEDFHTGGKLPLRSFGIEDDESAYPDGFLGKSSKHFGDQQDSSALSKFMRSQQRAHGSPSSYSGVDLGPTDTFSEGSRFDPALDPIYRKLQPLGDLGRTSDYSRFNPGLDLALGWKDDPTSSILSVVQILKTEDTDLQEQRHGVTNTFLIIPVVEALQAEL